MKKLQICYALFILVNNKKVKMQNNKNCNEDALFYVIKLLSRLWTTKNVESAFSVLMEELPLHPGAPGGMISYRRSLTLR